MFAAVALAAAVSAARGQTLQWDPGHTGSNTAMQGSGGTGTWDLTTANWYFPFSGTGDQTYPNDLIPTFAGAAGTVTLGAGNLQVEYTFFNTAGYTVQSAAGTSYGLTMTNANAFIQAAATSGTTTLNVPLTFQDVTTLEAAAGGTLAINGTISTTTVVAVGNTNGAFTGTVILSGNDTFRSGVTVGGGILVAAGNTALGSGNVQLAAGTQLTIQAGVMLSNQTASTLTLASATTSKVSLLGTGVQDTVNSLVINGVTQPAGTYGAAGTAGATYTPADFTGTGLLLVSPLPSAVPEPSVWAWCGFGAGLFALLRHRRDRRA